MHEDSLAQALVEQVERDPNARRWRIPCTMDYSAASGARNPKRTSHAIDGKARRVEGEDPTKRTKVGLKSRAAHAEAQAAADLRAKKGADLKTSIEKVTAGIKKE